MNKKNTFILFSILSTITAQNVLASETKNYDGICKEIYPEICKTSTSCYDEEKIKYEKMHNFCVELVQKNNFLDNTLANIVKWESRILSKENPEALKREFPEIRNEINETEKKIVENVLIIRDYVKLDEDLSKRFNSKTSLLEKEAMIANNKSFLLYVMKDNNLKEYRDFYETHIKTNDGEKSISDFKDKVLTKKECVNLMFHTVKSYRLNEGVDAIREVTKLLNDQNVKCK